MLVVPVVISITGSPLQASPGLWMEKVSRPCLMWSQPCEPVSFLFHLTLMALCYLMRLRLLTAGPGSSSSEQKRALWTQHSEGSLNDPAGVDPGSFHAKWKLGLGKHSTGHGALCSSLSPKLTFGLSCCTYILYYLPLTTNISKAHGLCLMPLNSAAMMETWDFMSAWLESPPLGEKTVIAFWVISPPLILFIFIEGFW